jgi:deazaflavin-dependent oxidoreductase (nitroreductase family)
MPADGVQTMRLQGVANVVVRTLLATPLVARGIGRKLVTLHVVGRKTGRRYSVPVAYAKDGDVLVVGSPFGWTRNLRTGDDLEVRYLGRRRVAQVEAFTEEAGVTAQYALMCRVNPTFANFNKIRRDQSGEPDPTDLRDAWVKGARAFRLTLR